MKKNKSFEQIFLNKYPKNGIVLRYWKNATGNDISFENVTKDDCAEFVKLLLKNMCTNSAQQYCKQIRSVLSFYADQYGISKETMSPLTIRGEVSQHVYLNIDEVNLLINCYSTHRWPNNPSVYDSDWEQYHIVPNDYVVLCRFLIGCLTGARHSDYNRFKANNIVCTDGLKNLTYVSQKTKIAASIPVCDALERLIKDNETKYWMVDISDETECSRIKVICRCAGINQQVLLHQKGEDRIGSKWSFVGTHTARRSFATNLYINMPSPDIYTISRMMGHKSIEMTKGYICCPPRIDGDVREIFNLFDTIQ